MNIFDLMYEQYKITKPIRLIELFGGYGSQYFALKYLGANVKHWKLVEWAVPSIQAYKDAHFQEDTTDYSKDLTDNEVIDYLFKMGISRDYNEPMSLDQIKRLKNIRTIYNNIKATDNLVNIMNVKASDLKIVDTDKYEYIMTYSFPCQDLSLAGLGKGMARDSGTRSGMLWEVERILDECIEKPQILLMENVPEVKGTNNVQYFNEWQMKLESLGYKNYHQNLIATDYGIPQTRNRTFMISILGDYSYTFPNPIPLKLKLKDMLEENVDEKYYLSDKMLDYMTGKNAKESKYNRGQVFARNFNENKEVAATITTAAGQRPTDNFIKETICLNSKVNGKQPSLQDRVYDTNEMSTTLCTSFMPSIMVKEATKKGYAIAHDGDGVYIQNIKGKRGMVQKGKMQTLKTSPDTGVVDGLRIRKLTPKECFRLMGVKDEDYERIAVNQSNASLYHLAGDSIVINVLMAIFKQLL